MESQLLECLEALSSAGDDERARLRKVSRTVGYEELPKSWKALVRIAAAKTSPKRQDEGASGSKKAPRRAGGFADRPQTQAKRLLETRKKATLLFNSADIYCYNPMSVKVELTPLKSGRGVIRGFIQHGRGWQERLRFSLN